MKSKEVTKLDILINVLKDKYNDYYEKNIGHDFLANIDECDRFDTISYLIGHIKKLKVTDKQYASYLQHCYAIFAELQYLVRLELKATEENYVDLISRSFTYRKSELSLLLTLGINDPIKIDELYQEIQQDHTEWLSDVILNLIDSYKEFGTEKASKLSIINTHLQTLLTSIILLKH